MCKTPGSAGHNNGTMMGHGATHCGKVGNLMQQQKNRLHTLNSLCTLPYHAPTSFEGIPKFYRKWNFEKKGRKKPFTGILPFEQVVESKKCLGGQKRSSALLVRVCCCLLCISNLPWASRPTPLKTFEQHPVASQAYTFNFISYMYSHVI